MATERKIASVAVNTAPGADYNTVLEAAIDAALPPAENWTIVYVEPRVAGLMKDSYLIWAQRDV